MTIIYYSTPWFMDCDLPLVKAMMNQGHQVYYLMSINPSSANATLLNNCKLFEDYDIHHASEYKSLRFIEQYMSLDNFYVINYPQNGLTSLNKLYHSWTLYRKLMKFLRDLNPDIYHVTGIQRSFAYYQARAFKNKLVCTMHDPIPHDLSSISKFRLITAKKFLRLPRKVILLNNQQTDAFCQRYQVESNRIEFSRLGVYECTKLFTIHDNTRNFRYILFFGRIQPYKGVESLIRAMRIVHKTYPDLHLVIAGKGTINETWDESYVEVNNRFIDTDELADMLRYCEFSVCPYLSATQSGVINTAFSMEVPVIATNVGGMKENIKDGVTGLLIEPNDVIKLAEAIIRLHKDESMRNKFVDNIKHENAEGYLSWKEISNIYMSIYQGL